jgi:hypothetical protein
MERLPHYQNQGSTDTAALQSDDAGSASDTGQQANPGLRSVALGTTSTTSVPVAVVAPLPQVTGSPALALAQTAPVSWDYAVVQEALLAQSAESVERGLKHFGGSGIGLAGDKLAVAYFKAVFDAFRRVRVVINDEDASSAMGLLSPECLSQLTIEHLECVLPAPSSSGGYSRIDVQEKLAGHLKALSAMLKFLDKARKDFRHGVTTSLHLFFVCREEKNDFHASWNVSRDSLYHCLRNSKLITELRIERLQGKADRDTDGMGRKERPVSELIPVLRTMKSLQCLHLCDNDIDVAQVKELVEVLRKLDSIAVVDLRRNPIGDRGKEALEQLRPTRQSMQILY